MGFIPSKYAPLTEKGTLVMPYISLMIKKNSKESLTTIFVQHMFIYIFHLTENCGHHNDTVTNSHKQELVFLCTEVYRTPSHKYTKMTVTKTNATISLIQPNDISMGCKVFKVPF